MIRRATAEHDFEENTSKISHVSATSQEEARWKWALHKTKRLSPVSSQFSIKFKLLYTVLYSYKPLEIQQMKLFDPPLFVHRDESSKGSLSPLVFRLDGVLPSSTASSEEVGRSTDEVECR